MRTRVHVSALLCLQLAATSCADSPTEIESDEGDAIGVLGVASGNTGDTSGGTSVTLQKPAGVTAGMLEVAALTISDAAVTITPPTGFTLVDRQNIGATAPTMAFAVYQHVATSSEPASYTFTIDVARSMQVGLVTFSGVDASMPIEAHVASQFATATTAPTTGTATAAGANDTVVAIFANRNTPPAYSTWTMPAGFVEDIDAHTARTSTTATNASVAMAHRQLTAAGAVGPYSATSSQAGLAATELLVLRATCGQVSSLLVPACGAWLGAWSANHGVTDWIQSIQEHEARIGRTLNMVHSYHPAGSTPLNAEEKQMAATNRIVVVNWKPAAKWADAAGGNSSVDASIDAAANSIKSIAPHKIMLTLSGEPERYLTKNGGSGGTATDYLNMWHHVRQRFDAAGVTNVVWFWNPMIYSKFYPDEISVYPGDAYVDWVMWDPYSVDGKTTAHDLIAAGYNWLTTNSAAGHLFTSKPWGLAEYGVNVPNALGGTFEQQFYTDVAANFLTFPKVKAYLIFDSLGAWDTRTNNTSAEQASYNAMAHKPFVSQPIALP